MSDMMTKPNAAARQRILSRIKTAVGGKDATDPRLPVVEARLSQRQRHLVPARARLAQAELRAQFAGYLTRGKASVIDVATRDELPEAIATYLRAHNLPLRLRMGTDQRLASLPWTLVPGLDLSQGRADPADEVTLSYAVAAAAETGTLVLASGPDNPVTLSFLPDTHMVVLDATTLVGAYEDAFDLVRAKLGDRVMPRTLNLISGPSRTSDIGGKTVMGAHGPRHLAVFIVG
jgi:L-lactate dehydrogenase complex protein LldG